MVGLGRARHVRPSPDDISYPDLQMGHCVSVVALDALGKVCIC